MKARRVLLVDDHQVLRDGVRSYLAHYPEIEVVGEASDGKESLVFLEHEMVDLVVMDLNMEEMDGISCAQQIVEKYPATAVLMLTMTSESQYVRESIKVGAKGYLLKSCEKGDIGKAILEITDGGTFYSPEILSVAQNYREIGSKISSKNIFEIPLTKREKGVLELIIEQKSNKEIAEELNISHRTVEVHKRNLIEKTGSKNIAGLIVYAARNNLLNTL